MKANHTDHMARDEPIRARARSRKDAADESTLLTTQEAAKLLGHHVSSVKRWNRTGELEAAKTKGGHRRFTPQQIRKACVELIPDSLPNLVEEDAVRAIRAWKHALNNNFSPSVELMRDWLSSGHAERLKVFVDTLLETAGHGYPVFVDDIVAPLMQIIGEDWRNGRISIADEHYYTKMVQDLLSGLIPTQGPSNGSVVVLMSADGNHHSLVLTPLEHILVSTGFRVVNLGSSLPADEIVPAALRHNAGCVCLSFGPLHQVVDVERTVRVIQHSPESNDITFILGGSPFQTNVDGPDFGSTKIKVARSAVEFEQELRGVLCD